MPLFHRRRAAAALLPLAALLLASLPAPAAPPDPGASAPEVDFTWGVKIPMRDGVRLNATLYRPRTAGRVPLLYRVTPYTPDSWHADGMYFARHADAFACVDVRGRGNSEGRFEPWNNDGRDGYDTVEWLARQPWSNGQVAMYGESYNGRAVWSTLKEGPPHLAAAVPIAPGYAIRFWKNDLTPDILQGLAQMGGVTSNVNLADDSSFWIEKLRELYLRHLPLRQFDRVVGFPSEIFQRVLDHPEPDPYWDAIAPTADDYRRMDLPLLTVTGAYDSHNASSLYYYRQHQRYAPAAGRDRHYLVIGPWDHGGTFRPRRQFGGLTFGPASVIDMQTLLLGWLDFALHGAPPPAFLQKRVAYYVIGAEEWRYADSLESITGGTRNLYLASDGGPGGGANDLFHSGRLAAEAPRGASADRYVYDPLDVRPAELEREEVENPLTDARTVANLFGNGLVYHGEPLAAEIEIPGEPRLTAWISLDVPDTDFDAALYLVTPSGESQLL